MVQFLCLLQPTPMTVVSDDRKIAASLQWLKFGEGMPSMPCATALLSKIESQRPPLLEEKKQQGSTGKPEGTHVHQQNCTLVQYVPATACNAVCADNPAAKFH